MTPCPKCESIGETHDPNPKRCQAHKSAARGGMQCLNPPMRGLTVCRSHGGRARQAKAAGLRRVAEERAAAKVGRLVGDSRPVDDPVSELARITGRVVAMSDAAEALVAELEEQGGGGTGGGLLVATMGGHDLHPLVKLAERTQERATKALAELVKLGLVERRVELEARDSQVLEGVLVEVLAEAGVDAGLVLPRLGARLRELAAGGDVDVIDVEVIEE